jgi:transcriptional regulator with XRE-family HTH domain
MMSESLRQHKAWIQQMSEVDTCDPDDKKFYEAFEKGIQLHGLTKRDLAELFGVSRSTVRRWLNSDSSPAPLYKNFILFELRKLSENKIRLLEEAGERPRWEYRVIEVYFGEDDELNALGQEGWELVTVADHIEACEHARLAYFKRQCVEDD